MSGATFRVSGSPDATESIGAELATQLLPGDVVLLEGDLAAGKTTFARGLLHGLGGRADEVSSPTFVLLQTYPCETGGIVRLHHVDLYRIADRITDLRQLGLEDVFSDRAAVAAVEWPKAAMASWIPGSSRRWRVRIEILDDDTRRITVTSPTK